MPRTSPRERILEARRGNGQAPLFKWGKVSWKRRKQKPLTRWKMDLVGKEQQIRRKEKGRFYDYF